MCEDFKPTSVDELKFNSHITEIQGHRVITLTGELDLFSAPQFQQFIAGFLDGTEQNLIIDMHKVTYIDSTGISTLVSVLKRISPDGGTVNLVGCTPSINHILSVTKISNYVALHQNIDDALRALSA